MMAGACMGQFIHELRTEKMGKEGVMLSSDYAARIAKAAYEAEQRRKERSLMSDSYNLDCSRNPPSEPFKDEVSANVNKRLHSHYFKDVAHLAEIDVYRVCDLYCDDRSGATQHAIKKLLLPGERGAGKSRAKDYQEAIDTLNRKLAMLKEDEAA